MELRSLDCICTKVSLAAWEYLERWHLMWLLAMMAFPALVSPGLWWVSFLLSRGKHLMLLLASLISLVLILINNEITGPRLSKSISLACGTTQFENKNKSNAREAKWMQIKVWRNLLAPIRLFCFFFLPFKLNEHCFLKLRCESQPLLEGTWLQLCPRLGKGCPL